MHYDKLVRDRIPEIVEESGDEPVTHVADDEEYGRRLADKLVEEAEEYREDASAEELADVLAVIDAIRGHEGIDEDDLSKLQAEKSEERGEFEDRIVLERVE